jgi:hypothetical protein
VLYQQRLALNWLLGTSVSVERAWCPLLSFVA